MLPIGRGELVLDNARWVKEHHGGVKHDETQILTAWLNVKFRKPIKTAGVVLLVVEACEGESQDVLHNMYNREQRETDRSDLGGNLGARRFRPHVCVSDQGYCRRAGGLKSHV